MQKKYFEHPFISFLPLLALYFILIIVQNNDAFFGDEGRYIMFAQNLLHGFYSPPPPDINLWNGPGYPLFLAPFIALGIPFIAIKLVNALIYYFILILFYKTLSSFLDKKKLFRFSLLFACYYMPYKGLPHMLSETFTIFLVASITYCAVIYFSDTTKKKKFNALLLLSILLAFLALTKVIFGAVYLVAATIFILLFLFTRKTFYINSLRPLLMALILCIPYLFYTWSLTGKIFYWSNAGGKSLYWMSNPVAGEYGEWHKDLLITGPDSTTNQSITTPSHRVDNDLISQYTGIERDEKFKELALKNILSHPGKFFINWLANWSRMFFNFPADHLPIRLSTVGNMIANIPLLVLLGMSAFMSIKKKNRLPDALKFLLCVAAVYLLGSSMLSAYDRMFYILVPVFGFWISYSFTFFSKNTGLNQKSK